MRIRSKLKSAEFDMTSMIDVVFLLIVFFSLVMNFVEADQDERIKLPVSELAQPPELPPTEPITLHVRADGSVIYNGREQSQRDLQGSLDHHMRFLRFMNIPPDKVTVIIRADVQCECGQVFNLIELCQDLKLNWFVLRTRLAEE